MKTHCLLAEWNNLIMANYVVPKELLLPFVPYVTQLDSYEGNFYLSLVGFMFLNTRVMGFKIPMHTNFEEINLRFYVKYNDRGLWKTGVVFIKEIVPRKAISFIANNLYGEKYITLTMKHYHLDDGEFLEAGYEWEYQKKWNKLSAKTDKKSSPIKKGSQEEFIADHYWGYAKYSPTKTYEYEVEHPVWECLKVISYSVDCDFGALYGENFSFLNKENPQSVYLVKGSEIRVHNKRTLE